MTRHTPLFVLLALQALAASAGLAFHTVVRPKLLSLPRVPPVAAMALSNWLVPTCVLAGLALTLVGLVLRSGRSRLRWTAIGTGVGMVPALAILVAYASLLT